MSKLLLIYGCALLSSSPVTEEQQSSLNQPVQETKTEIQSTFENSISVLRINAEVQNLADTYMGWEEDSAEFDLDEIEFVEDEAEIDLGFDTSAYLPEGFNPYENYFDLNSIIFLEEDVEFNLDTESYLPSDFDAYSEVLDVHSINYIEEEDGDLGFNTEEDRKSVV